MGAADSGGRDDANVTAAAPSAGVGDHDPPTRAFAAARDDESDAPLVRPTDRTRRR